MNKIRTTALIEAESMELLYRYAALRKQKLSRVVELVLLEIIKRKFPKNRIRLNSSVKYQKSGKNIVLLHYSVSPNIYEACLDLRKFGKMSVSRILNEGITFLLIPFSGDKDKQFHNYLKYIAKMDNYELIYFVVSKKYGDAGLITIKIRLKKSG